MTHKDFVREMKRRPLPAKRVAPRQTRAHLTESQPPLKNYPRSHRGFLEAMRKPIPALVNGRPVNLLKRLREQDDLPLLHTPDSPTPHDGELCEICKFLDDETLSDSQKLERIEAFVGGKEGAQLDEFRKILITNSSDSQKLELIAAHVDEERVAVEDVEESFVKKLNRGSWRR